jgi:hypothetical protein
VALRMRVSISAIVSLAAIVPSLDELIDHERAFPFP